MTAQASRGETTPVPVAEVAVVLARHRRLLRLALGTTLSFVTAEMLDWELSFVITAFLVQLLTLPGPAPGLRQGIATVLVLGLATSTAATLSGLLVDMPALFAIVLGLVLFFAFGLQRSGRSPAVATLILVAFSLLPVIAVQAPEQVPAVAYYLVRSGAVAVLWVWLLHALLPEPEAATPGLPGPKGAAAPPDGVVRGALTDTAVLLPVLVLAMTLEVPAALVVILTVTAVLRQHSLAGGRQVALSLLLGNLMGGLTAMVAYELLSAVPTLGFLTALLLLVSLVYARLIVGATSLAPLYVTALVTFIIVFGMGVAPFLDQPEATLAIRLRNLAIACVYAFAALSLIGHSGRPSVANETQDT
jgi:hypothetical protein